MRKYVVYITAKNVSEARKLSRALLDGRLAACVNLLGPIVSMYRWKGVIRNDREIALLAKTTAGRLDALIRKIRALHSYDVPCIVALPIAKGNPEFLHWIGKETQSLRRPSKPARMR